MNALDSAVRHAQQGALVRAGCFAGDKAKCAASVAVAAFYAVVFLAGQG